MHKLWLMVILLVLIKSFIWLFVVPILQTPDEQAHFAQLQWYAEKKNLKIDPVKNLSLELAATEEILGTRRDNSGNNKYTYHPEYKNNSSIPNFPFSYRTVYVDREVAAYPPLYYLLDLPFYFVGYFSDLTTRIILARLLSVILTVGLALTAFFVGLNLWKDRLLAWTLAVLVVFQPMVSFVSAGVHPDNLLNLIGALIILTSLKILKEGIKAKYLFWLLVLFASGLETKILVVFFLPISAAVVIYKYYKNSLVGGSLALLVLVMPVLAFVFRWPLPLMPEVNASSPLGAMSFIEYLKFRLPKTVFEIWPWYWGVFKWLGVTLSPLTLKIITRVAGICLLGLAWHVVRHFKDKFVWYFILTAFTYYLYLILWDYRLMQSIGYSQGLQGRYLFPTIVAHMALFLTGATVVKNWAKPIAILLALGMIILNGLALATVAKSYYAIF